MFATVLKVSVTRTGLPQEVVALCASRELAQALAQRDALSNLGRDAVRERASFASSYWRSADGRRFRNYCWSSEFPVMEVLP